MINLFCISTILCISLLKRLYPFFIYFGTEYFLNIFSFSAVNKNRFVRDLIRIFLSVISIHSLSKLFKSYSSSTYKVCDDILG